MGIQRLMENRGLSEAESTALINVQMSLDKKSEKADYVLENSGNLQDLKQQVMDIHQKLNQSTLHWKIRLNRNCPWWISGHVLFSSKTLWKHLECGWKSTSVS